MSFWDRIRRGHCEPEPSMSSLRSRLEAVRRELAALEDSSDPRDQPGADLQACGPLTLVEIGGRERLATLGRGPNGERVIGEVLRSRLAARRIAEGRTLWHRLTGG